MGDVVPDEAPGEEFAMTFEECVNHVLSGGEIEDLSKSLTLNPELIEKTDG